LSSSFKVFSLPKVKGKGEGKGKGTHMAPYTHTHTPLQILFSSQPISTPHPFNYNWLRGFEVIEFFVNGFINWLDSLRYQAPKQTHTHTHTDTHTHTYTHTYPCPSQTSQPSQPISTPHPFNYTWLRGFEVIELFVNEFKKMTRLVKISSPHTNTHAHTHRDTHTHTHLYTSIHVHPRPASHWHTFTTCIHFVFLFCVF
jgi:hypothetical protein